MIRSCQHSDSRCHARAMTLVEVLVASVILGVGVAGLLSATALGMRNQGRSEQRMAALYFAQEKLAEVEAVGPRMWSLTREKQGSQQREEIMYSWSLAIVAMTEGELYDVLVTMEWNGPTGGGKLELETLLNDYKAAAMLDAGLAGEDSPLAPTGEDER